MKTNWFQKFCTRYRGYHTDNVVRRYMPENIGEMEEVYQSSDLPWVFLGGADRSEMQQAEQLAGQPICARIDVTDADTRHLPEPLTQKIPFPEFKIWDDQSYSETKNLFNKTVDMVTQTISSRRCPIYIHCSAGANRSVSILAAAISRITGKSIFEILREMKSKRGIVSPHDVYVMMAVENSTNPHDVSHRQQLLEDVAIDEDSPSSNTELELKSTSTINPLRLKV